MVYFTNREKQLLFLEVLSPNFGNRDKDKMGFDAKIARCRTKMEPTENTAYLLTYFFTTSVRPL